MCYKSLMERMKDEERPDPKEAEEKAGSESGPRKDLGPMPFSILPPHMLNMMERWAAAVVAARVALRRCEHVAWAGAIRLRQLTRQQAATLTRQQC